MKTKPAPNLLLPGLGVFLLLNLLTAALTELYSDEAYYWMYAQQLDWGYFDHPPAVAVLIKIGTLFGKTELAVRALSALAMTVALWLTFRMSGSADTPVFLFSVFSMFSLNILSFVALPDEAFVLFGVLFLYCYRAYLAQPSWRRAAVLGVVGAGLLYSKYHGVLIIGFAVLGNLKLLRDRNFYLAALVCTVLFIPHVWWQFVHGFPSLRYHLVERHPGAYNFQFTLDYLTGNLPFHGPWASLVFFVGAWQYRAADQWERALKFILFGTFAFFLFNTRNGFIEANWTLFCIIPLLILGLKRAETWGRRFRRTYMAVAAVFALVILLFRVHLVHPLVDIARDRAKDFHGHRQFAQETYQRSGGLPVVADTYQNASLLSFYAPAGQPLVPSLNISGRSNQFSIWRWESAYCGKPVAYANARLDGVAIGVSGQRLSRLPALPSVTTLRIGEAGMERLIGNRLRVRFRVIAPLPGCPPDAADTFAEVHLRYKSGPDETHRLELGPRRPADRYEYTLHLKSGEPLRQAAVFLGSNTLQGLGRVYAELEPGQK